MPPMMNNTPSRPCIHFQPTTRRPSARNSLTPANSRITPSSTPTDATDVILNRSTITEISSHRIPVTRKSHHIPEAARAPIFEELSMHPPSSGRSDMARRADATPDGSPSLERPSPGRTTLRSAEGACLITRQQFIDGTAYPPASTGMRGSHPGSFEVAHAIRDGERFDVGAVADGDAVDLVVVGAGISGLAAAWFYRREHPDATILLLDNHDDFGGHAKRNEFT